jgi:predicted permease
VARGLVVAEIALSLVALGGGTVLVRAFLQMLASDGGFDESALVTARLNVPGSVHPEADGRTLFIDRILEETGALSGARATAVVNALPRGLSAPTDTFGLASVARVDTEAAPRAVSLRASPGYVEALGIPVIRGRFFTDADRLGSDPVAVVNRSWADRWSADENPVGRTVRFAGADRRIVGVVADVQQVLIRTPGIVDSEVIYVPAAQDPLAGYTLVIAGDGDPARLKEPLRQTVAALDPDVTLSQVLTFEEVIDQFFAGIRVFNTILGGFGLIAILLASIGTYGVLAYQVAQRRQEIGIRMAVGADQRTVLGMVARQGVLMSALGLALGGLLLLPLVRLVGTLLEGFATVQGETGFWVAGLLFTVTVLASWLPARRAAALDPVRALGDD